MSIIVLSMMNHKVLHTKLPLLGLITVFMSSCVPRYDSPIPKTGEMITDAVANAKALKFRRVLVAAIESADRIVITEHSAPVDFFWIIPDFSKAPEYIYAKKELSIGEKILFLEETKKLKVGNKRGAKRSLFVPHHRIDFYEGGELKNNMSICYKCNEIRWNGTSYEILHHLFDSIDPTMKRAGMKSSRDWEALAKQGYTAKNKSKSQSKLQEPD